MGSTDFGQHKPVGMQAYAAPSLFQPHLARQAIRDAYDGKIPSMLGYYAGLSSVGITRLLAPMGWDCVWIDWEHTSCNVETMTTVSCHGGGGCGNPNSLIQHTAKYVYQK